MQQAAASEPLIEIRADARVTAVEHRSDGRLDVRADATSGVPVDAPFDVVINALWEGRPAVDASLGIQPIAPWSHRFRAAVFAYAPDVSFSSAVCAPARSRRKVLRGRSPHPSWYSAGLLAEGQCHRATAGRRRARSSATRCRPARNMQSLSSYFPPYGDFRIPARHPRSRAGGCTPWVKGRLQIQPARRTVATD
jgi:hypothetical protein